MIMFVRRLRRKWWLIALAVLVVVAGVLGYGFAETYRLETKEYTFTSPDLPKQFDGTRVVLVTDIHRGPFFSEERVRSLAERVNALDPDLVVLGGDYVYIHTNQAASCVDGLAALEAPLGCFAVLGNHDYGEHDDGIGGPEDVVRAFAGSDIMLLRNEATWIEKDGARIRIGGVGDYAEDIHDPGPTLQGTVSDDFVLLVSHSPDQAEHVPPDSVDLMLAGHTHGGQVTFFGLWAFHVGSDYGQKYRTGAVTNEATTVIISNGVGASGILPIRFFARPQIVVITLHRGEYVEVANMRPE